MTAGDSQREVGGYRLLRTLGSGGMGTVHEAVDGDGHHVALKLLHPHIGMDPTARRRLAREVSLLHRVRGDGVARVLDAEVEDAEAFVVTELIDGPTLEDDVAADGPFAPEELATLAHGLADSLRAIHAVGVVHRDLKPGNVMMSDHGPVVIDFGIAQVADDARLTQTGLVTGTPGYLDPEVIAGAEPSPVCDWWGWSAVLVFAATGRPPFGRGPTGAVLARVATGQADTVGLEPVVGRALRAALDPVPRNRLGPDAVLAVLDGQWGDAKLTQVLSATGEGGSGVLDGGVGVGSGDGEGAGALAAGVVAAGAAGAWALEHPAGESDADGDVTARWDGAAALGGAATIADGAAQGDGGVGTEAMPAVGAGAAGRAHGDAATSPFDDGTRVLPTSGTQALPEGPGTRALPQDPATQGLPADPATSVLPTSGTRALPEGPGTRALPQDPATSVLPQKSARALPRESATRDESATRAIPLARPDDASYGSDAATPSPPPPTYLPGDARGATAVQPYDGAGSWQSPPGAQAYPGQVGYPQAGGNAPGGQYPQDGTGLQGYDRGGYPPTPQGAYPPGGYPQDGGYPGAPERAPAWAIQPRRRTLVVGTVGLGVSALAAPLPGLFVLVAVGLLVLTATTGWAGRTRRTSRLRRGPRKGDDARMLVALPLHLLHGIFSSLLGVLIGGAFGAAAWWAAVWWAGSGAADPRLTEQVVLWGAGLIALLIAWLMPTSAASREGARAMIAVLTPTRGFRTLLVVLVLAVVAVMAAQTVLGGTPEPNWAPLPVPALPFVA
ncbi:serine/threonine-protein kinase [Georgenia sp. SYP-B2076]|uniref:serine/threonine-protein kinase n=1 Tax=Georgenia sp. SYP-B2076 TaxID=2495881 RepID=UPI000F8C7E8A|nr:serine/threonine-protein kinase [Georgenia sp. SYP-B2076]